MTSIDQLVTKWRPTIKKMVPNIHVRNYEIFVNFTIPIEEMERPAVLRFSGKKHVPGFVGHAFCHVLTHLVNIVSNLVMKITFHNHVRKLHNAVVRHRHHKLTLVLWHLPQKWSRDRIWFLLVYLGFNYSFSLQHDMQTNLHPQWPIKHSQWNCIPRSRARQSRVTCRHKLWMCFLPDYACSYSRTPHHLNSHWYPFQTLKWVPPSIGHVFLIQGSVASAVCW